MDHGANSDSDSEIRTPWTTSPPIHTSPPAAVAAVEHALRRYAELGIPLPAGNRLQMAGKLLRRFVGNQETLDHTDVTTLRRISDAMQTAMEHLLIARATRTVSGRLEPTHAQKIEESLSGAVTVETQKNSPGRDSQFELYVRALFAMASVPVQIAEPDLLFLYEDQIVGLAAKRVKQSKQVRKRFKEATEQIRKTGINGFVALGADLLITDLELDVTAADRGVRFSERLGLGKIDAEFSAYPHVLGRFTYATAFIWDFSTPQPRLEIASFRQFKAYTDSEAEIQIADRFHHAFNQRLEERMQQL